MARQTAISINTIPIGPLGIIGMPGCEELTDKIDKYLVKWRKTQASEHAESIAFFGYQRDTYKIDVSIPRFGSGEGKGVINESVRGYDIYIVCDVFNYSCSYDMYGRKVYMSPDDHFADLKRVISALCSKPKRVSVIMPMLYEGRQHKRSSRESLDCAMALKELVHLGVENIITFDAHDQRVQNAIPDKSFENVMPTYQMIKALVNNVEDLNVDNFDDDKFSHYKDKQEYLRIINLMIQDFIYEIYLKFYDFMKYKEYFEIRDYDRFLDKIFKSIDMLKPFAKDEDFRQLLQDIPIHYTALFYIFKNTLTTYNIKEDTILQLFEALCEFFGINRRGFEYTKNLPKHWAIICDVQLKNRFFSSFNYLPNIPWNNPKYKNYQH